MKKFLVLFFIIFTVGLITYLFYKYSNPPEESNTTTNSSTTEIQRGEFSIEFNQNKFTYGEEEDLLKELKECDSTVENDRDPLRPACSPRFFKFFPLDNGTTLKNGFILLIKATVRGSETRKTKIFQREKGILVLVNGFNGTLIERRKSATKYDDLVIRFGNRIDKTLHHFNCVFKWNGGKYLYDSCERIDDNRVKKEFKDSMNLDIKTMLEKEHYLF
jgi:hypothetical protein